MNWNWVCYFGEWWVLPALFIVLGVGAFLADPSNPYLRRRKK